MYDVGELASVSGLSVDTIRYYQTQGLLPPPERRGRRALYGDPHRERLTRIRALADRGYSLKSIRELLAGDGEASGDGRLRAALEERRTEAVYTPQEFARALGVPYPLLRSIEKTGLAAPQAGGGKDARYTEADLEMARGALSLLGRGLPLTELLSLAVQHDRAVRETVDRAIDLFDDHVRKKSGTSSDGEAEALDTVAEAYRELLPVVTGLVAHHFPRVLVNRALERLERSGERRSLATARRTAAGPRLRLLWR
jgi:DNA-binding transcriptional MerR regulator